MKFDCIKVKFDGQNNFDWNTEIGTLLQINLATQPVIYFYCLPFNVWK